MPGIGIDVGSTATKVAVVEGDELLSLFSCPTGYSSLDASQRALDMLHQRGYSVKGCPVVATGYGRVSVPWACRVRTEISCHARGAVYLFGQEGTVIDVGGQDTKVIALARGLVRKFAMNDKCAAGTGRFLEIMADRLGVSQDELSRLAREGSPLTISSMCTVFAESEVIALIGRGERRENIAFGVVESVVSRVVGLASGMSAEPFMLTGGLCDNSYVVQRLSAKLGREVLTCSEARYAGALGAALCALERKT